MLLVLARTGVPVKALCLRPVNFTVQTLFFSGAAFLSSNIGICHWSGINMASPGKSLFKLELASLKPRTKPCLQCTFHLYGQNRSLTSSSSRRRNMTQAGFNSSNLMQNIPKQKSSKSRIKEFSRSELPSDFGLLPQTFINPSSRYLPSWFSSLYKERARIAWLRLRSSVTGFFT